ncbi:MAG: hypothetical protein LBT43_16295 [Prevotella sp.]|jgi:hypothetical protein|nr:hypothetical protein [Prevotella sp.]
MKIIILIFYFLCLFLSLSAQSLLEVKDFSGPKMSIEICESSHDGYLVLLTKSNNLSFNLEQGEILKIDTAKYSGYTRYILCTDIKRHKSIAIKISDDVCEKDATLIFTKWYEIKKKEDIPRLIKETSHIAIQIGKGNTYSPMGSGLGASFLWQFEYKVGWGLQGGIGWYSIDEEEHTGTEIIESNFTKKSTTNFPHVSLGLKCYPLFKSKHSLVKGLNIMASYGTLGTKEFSAYNNLDGSFSLGGTKAMHGFTIMAGDDYSFTIGNKNLVVSSGVGAARSLNLDKVENVWRFAFDIGIGWYWKTKQKKK